MLEWGEESRREVMDQEGNSSHLERSGHIAPILTGQDNMTLNEYKYILMDLSQV